jgi:hypothetical protein
MTTIYKINEFFSKGFSYEVTGSEWEGEKYNKKRTRGMKFNEFMSGEYKVKEKEKRQVRARKANTISSFSGPPYCDLWCSGNTWDLL